MNPLLAKDEQTARYVVKAFILRPEVTLLDADGHETRRYLPINIAVNEADINLTFREYMTKMGLKMKSDGE